MKIQINTGHNIEGGETLSAHISEVVEHAMIHHREHITRVEVHLSDENGPDGDLNVIRCGMEERLEHHQPLTVSCEADSVHSAVDVAAEKLDHLVSHTLEKLHDERKHRTDPPMDPPIDLPGLTAEK
ncbi:MAG: HPF/RaiA family ribosome-associated protein [Kiritimatiellae bacterium]|jgi:ribosome-associated translation inhibitor RaiA|nr:HPF/RaiA family ribosome-associated protein [Kiritimatiellia bacterium]